MLGGASIGEANVKHLMIGMRQKILGLPHGWTRKPTGISDSRRMKTALQAMARELLESIREFPSKVTDANWEKAIDDGQEEVIDES